MAKKKVLRERGETNICFDCQLAVGFCPWCEVDPETKKIRWQPIDGWVADVVPYQNAMGNWGTTFSIKSCTMFVPDEIKTERVRICPLCGSEFLAPIKGRRVYCQTCVPEGYVYYKNSKKLMPLKRK